MWHSGRKHMRSSRSSCSNTEAMLSSAARILPWEIIAPLGLPVVPEV